MFILAGNNPCESCKQNKTKQNHKEALKNHNRHEAE